MGLIQIGNNHESMVEKALIKLENWIFWGRLFFAAVGVESYGVKVSQRIIFTTIEGFFSEKGWD